MAPTPLTYNSIIPVGTHLLYIGTAGFFSYDKILVVTKQDTQNTNDTCWVYVRGDDIGYNPRVFKLASPPEPQELWTL